MLPPFPELELKLCHQILSTIHISKLMNMDYQDIKQEIMIDLLENEEAWMKLRNRSTSTSLIYVALKNKILDFIDKTMNNSDLARHSQKQVNREIHRQLKSEFGSAFFTFLSLPEAERGFIKAFYNPTNTIKRDELKTIHRITETQAAKASRKVIRSARLDLTHGSLLSIDELEMDNV